MKKKHKITNVLPGSIAEELGIRQGDFLLCINDMQIEDIFDYRYLINDGEILVLIEKPDGEEWEFEIEKEENEDLGLEFAESLMDGYKSCQNKCIFCFIDQMPKGMRETLYFKDDDSRLSFLQGNYLTLTNMKDADIDRMIRYRMEPVNISIHTTDQKLRCMMLNNRFAGELLQKMDRFKQAGLRMNGQIVLCKGINDGVKLEESIKTLTGYLPYLQSLSIVPVGLTKFREGLYPLLPFEKKDAAEVLAVIHKWQEHCMKKHQTHFVHASDEWYLLAEQKLPEAARYDGYLQLENGVGMERLLEDEFYEALNAVSCGSKTKKKITVATGTLAAPLIETLCGEFMRKFPNIKIQVIPIRNEYFGERITVSGLLTGRDIVSQLKGKSLGEKLLLPCNLLRSGEEVFLDDMTLTELKNALQVKTDIVKSSGQDLVNALLA
ncbi:MAG: DUF512 domain-containing protein [Eubacterium sp.]|jgi:putative radical SAM enzyme (TIGR03279 family)|nr:DUF512 domain-containing protein [Eubacterium sp.]